MFRDMKEEFQQIVHTPRERIAAEAITAFCLFASSADKAFISAGINQHLVVAGTLCTAVALGDGLKFLDRRQQ